MAVETQNPAAPETETIQQVVVQPEASTDKLLTPTEAPENPATAEEAVVADQKPTPPEDAEEIGQSISFKEESYVVSELPDPQKKALDELKLLIQDALNKHEFTSTPPAKSEQDKKLAVPESVPAPAVAAEEPVVVATVAEEVVVAAVAETELPSETAEKSVPSTYEADGAKTVEAIQETVVAVAAAEVEETTEQAPLSDRPETVQEEQTVPPEEVFIWGIPLLGDERSDVILLKFLRARDFKVKEAFNMIKNTVRWRKEFGIDALLNEEFGNDWDKVVFTHGFDKQGHPVCYNVFGEFEDKELYQNTFGDEEKRSKFLRWRIQFLEKSIRKLDFSPNGISSIVQVNDLRNSPGLLGSKWELKAVTKQALQLLQDNYPEVVAKQVFINVPWWYLAVNRMISPFFTQRTKSKFVFAGPSKSSETLFKYIVSEQVPVGYGGLSREGEAEFSHGDAATEITIKPASKHAVELPVSEASELVWEARVVGWEVSYGAEFVPSSEDGYTVIVQKERKLGVAEEEQVIFDKFKVGETGRVVLNIENHSSKKKKLLYRYKTKPISS